MLTQVVERLSSATDLPTVTGIVAAAARELVAADGATFVLRDEDRCYYADEDAISPLWKGRRFPMESCISGWCMAKREVVIIRDITQDARIPQDAYRPTFVKSLCMVPIRSEDPLGAIGSYWAREHEPTAEEVKLLQILANNSAVVLQNLELRQALTRRRAEHDELESRQLELELQVNSIAHDLKSPLGIIMGFADLLQGRLGAALDEKSRHYITSILRTGRSMNRQVERMLALYRLSNQTITKQPVNLSDLAAAIVEGLAAQDPKRSVEVQIAPGLLASADPDLLRLALENLLSNAFKYSRGKPATWVRVDRRASSTPELDTFVIEDHGDGFDPAQAGRLFHPLVRLHDATRFAGTGLGLASVARIIELHGGTVEAEGRPGEGATFSFSLPATTRTRAPRATAEPAAT